MQKNRISLLILYRISLLILYFCTINMIAKRLSLLSILVFDMKLLVTFQVTAGKTIIKESHSEL